MVTLKAHVKADHFKMNQTQLDRCPLSIRPARHVFYQTSYFVVHGIDNDAFEISTNPITVALTVFTFGFIDNVSIEVR